MPGAGDGGGGWGEKGSPGEGGPRGPKREVVTTTGGRATTEHGHYLSLSSQRPLLRVRLRYYFHFTSEKRECRKGKGLTTVTQFVGEAGTKPGKPGSRAWPGPLTPGGVLFYLNI